MATENVITIAVHLNAPPDRVFQAWTTPADLEEWLADRATVNPSVGGSYRLETDGGEEMPGLHICSGTYTEIIPGWRIVTSWRYEGPDPADTVDTTITVDLEADDSGTTMRFREAGGGLVTEDDRALSIEAWSGAFDALAALVEE